MIFRRIMTNIDIDINTDLLASSYDYLLPERLIASRPAKRRDLSRLLVYKQKSDKIVHAHFYQLADFLPENSLLVVNQSKVFPCRLIGKKSTGGKAEIFVLSLIAEEGDLYPCMVRATSKKKVGTKFEFSSLNGEIIRVKDDGTFLIRFDTNDFPKALEEMGQVPIPPYIRDGVSDSQDREDYQTVYAKEMGSVAAPTAGLHFTDEVFSELDKKNIDTAKVSLHVGIGTFATVKDDDIRSHKMHSEFYKVDGDNIKKIKYNDNVFAVGTTSLRVLESCTDSHGHFSLEDEELHSTNIFLHPGKEVRSIRGLITNFHLPKSTLLMLVSAIIGRKKTMELYEEAIAKEYRFFSYGDAMLILRDE